MSLRTRALRAGSLLAGAFLGVVLAATLGWLLLQSGGGGPQQALRTRLGLPADAFDFTRLGAGRLLGVTLREVALLDPSGDTVLAAPAVRFTVDARSLAGDGRIVVTRAELVRPRFRVRQEADGTWNFTTVTAVQTEGRALRLAQEPGRGVLVRDVRIVDGSGIVYTPAFGAAAGVVVARRVRDVEGRLAAVRAGGPEPWRVDVAGLTGRLVGPEVRILELRGALEQLGEDGVRFALERLRTPNSSVSGSGAFVFGDAGGQLAATLRAAPLDFRDLRGLGIPRLPGSGTARFTLEATPREAGRVSWRVGDAEVLALGSRVVGGATLVAGGDGPVAFGDTRLELAPLRVSTLRELGFGELPVDGAVTGTVTGGGEASGALRLDLAAELRPADAPNALPSQLTVNGALGYAAGAGFRAEGVRLDAAPLRLEMLAGFAPERAELLRGTLDGGATLTGTAAELRVTDGAFTYAVGDAPETRFTNLAAVVSLEPRLRYEVDARADPLALATLTELFPALPFENASLSGPLTAAGGAEGFRFDADLQGPAGGVALGGRVALDEVPAFDVEGRLDAFRTGTVLASGSSFDQPLSGTFAASGTVRDFSVRADLTQGAGSFALRGGIGLGGESPRLDVNADVSDFRLGSLIGRPGVLASPVSGRVSIGGSPGQPYRFDLDVAGTEAAAQVTGSYTPGEVPTYRASGGVRGLNLRGVPGLETLPQSRVSGVIDVAGRGTTPETLAGRFYVAARDSLTSDALLVRAVAEQGVLRVDTLNASLAGVRLQAEGTLGLVRPSPEPLEFSFTAADLSTLASVLPPPGPLVPDLAGRLAARGTIAGTLRSPRLAVGAEGEGLRYEEWQAASLRLQGEAADGVAGWDGSVTLSATEAVAPVVGALQAVELSAEIAGDELAVGLFARRDAGTELRLSSAAELIEGRGGVRGIAFDTLSLRLDESRWVLERSARVRYAEDGLAVSDLLLRRVEGSPGEIAVEGTIPSRGVADLRLRASGVRLAELHRLFPGLPEVRGTLAGSGALSGPVEQPRFDAELHVDSLGYQEATAERVDLTLAYADAVLTAEGSVRAEGREALTATAAVPFRLSLLNVSPDFRLLRDSPLEADVVADSLPMRLLAAAVPGLRDGTGAVNAEVRLGGTLAELQVGGETEVDSASVAVEALGVRLENLTARLALADRRLRIATLTATSGAGRASLRGTVGLSDPERPELDVRATFDRFRAMDRSDVARDLVVSGDLAFSGALPEPTLSGAVVVNGGSIVVPELDEARETEIVDADVGQLGVDTVFAANGGAGALSAVSITDLRVGFGNDVWLENPDARVQIEGDLSLYSAGGVPRVFGTIQTVRGSYALRIQQITREFEVERGAIVFVGTPDPNPELDIVAVNTIRTSGTETSELRILVEITGTLESPRINLTSDTRPPLPESQLLSYLIFGSGDPQLGGLPGQLAGQLVFQELIGGQLIAGTLERALSRSDLVDYVRVTSGGPATRLGTPGALESTLGSTAVELGKQIVPNVFLTVNVGVQALFGNRTQFGVGAEWEIDRATTLRGAFEPVRRGFLFSDVLDPFNRGPDYQLSVDLRRRWEFGRPAEEERDADGSEEAAPPPER